MGEDLRCKTGPGQDGSRVVRTPQSGGKPPHSKMGGLWGLKQGTIIECSQSRRKLLWLPLTRNYM
jgi:hypothetical protein